MGKKTGIIIMLPTENKENAKLAISKNHENLISIFNKDDDKYNQWKCQHLYIISDEEIKEDGWVYSIITKDVFQLINTSTTGKWLNKIILTTDPSLNLPLIPNDFIELYIESYNNGNVIEDVIVEIVINSGISMLDISDDYPFPDSYYIKVSITPIKQSFTREEVIEILKQRHIAESKSLVYNDVDLDDIKWFNSNY